MEVDTKKVVIGLVLVFILGVLFALVNGWYTTQTNQQLPLIVYAIAFVSIVVGATIVLLFQWKISKMQLEKILKILPREERLVVQALFAHNNELEQNKIVVLSGLSKLQVSRTVQKLAERGVVEKKSSGMTNLIMLKL